MAIDWYQGEQFRMMNHQHNKVHSRDCTKFRIYFMLETKTTPKKIPTKDKHVKQNSDIKLSRKEMLTPSFASSCSAQPFKTYGSLTATQITESTPFALNLSILFL